MNCARCTDLAEENAYLRRQLALEVAADRAALLAKRLETSPARARILIALHAAQGKVVRKEALAVLSQGADTENWRNTLDAQVCHIRTRLGRDVVEAVRAQGYRLTDAGREVVGRALAEVASG